MSDAVRIVVKERLEDQLWRLNNLYHCVDENGKKIPFRMNDHQMRLYREMWYMNLILKARQMGFTTFIGILGLDQALFNDDFSTGMCAHSREDVGKIFDKKVKFPYLNMPEQLITAIPTETDNARSYKFANGSSIEVSLSLRSGTFQMGHISEFGKICAKFPHKAKEIVTGALETIHPGNAVFIESTAEGREGYFHDWVMEAQKRDQLGIQPSKLQYKLHFFPWYEDSKNTLDPKTQKVSREIIKYLNDMEAELDIEFTAGQAAWYAAKSETLAEDMFREHPSTVEEAFKASIEGSYLKRQMAFLRKNKRIGKVPFEPGVPVNTGWDLGTSDECTYWLHQKVGMEHRIFHFNLGTGEGLDYYWSLLERMAAENTWTWGYHFFPHDAGHKQKDDGKTLADKCRKMGMRNVIVVPRTPDKIAAIQETRDFLPLCWFDEEGCDEGIKALDNYSKEWDENMGCFKEKPRHDWASHRYDSIETLARGLAMGVVPAGSAAKRTTKGQTPANRRQRSWRTR